MEGSPFSKLHLGELGCKGLLEGGKGAGQEGCVLSQVFITHNVCLSFFPSSLAETSQLNFTSLTWFF
jgi:hypothetical protein